MPDNRTEQTSRDAAARVPEESPSASSGARTDKVVTKNHGSYASSSLRSLMHPRVILIIAIILPGVGQVINRQPMRGLMMVFFMLVMSVVCYQLTTPEHSVLGRFAGGWFIYALSIMDAYQFARRRWEIMRYKP